MSTALRRIATRVRGVEAAEAVLALLDEASRAVSAFEMPAGEWRLEAYPDTAISLSELTARLAIAAVGAGGELLEICEEALTPRDWLADNQLSFPPLRIGRFFVYRSHYRGRIPAAAIPILLDAATAFGTGEHPSTRGCLAALEGLARRGSIQRPLDIGTGTGILAIAVAKLLHRQVQASDIEEGSVAVARCNMQRNRVPSLVRVERAAGYKSRIMKKRHYDLIFANILARPLAVMAADLARNLAPGGHAVLSGLLRRQESVVLVPHRALGLTLERRIVIDGWSTLVLRKPARAAHHRGSR